MQISSKIDVIASKLDSICPGVFENQFSRVGFLANCHRAVLTLTPFWRVRSLSPTKHKSSVAEPQGSATEDGGPAGT